MVNIRPKRVVVVASGETERAAIPFLVDHLLGEGIVVVEILIPSRTRALTVEVAEGILKDAWYTTQDNLKPDKFVILVDVDGKRPREVLLPFQRNLTRRLGPQITASIQFAYAKWHLEAWFFGDSDGLRGYFGGRSLGSVDSSQPDTIENPKQHLRNLLGGNYTRFTAADIASQLNPLTIASRSFSFRGFIEAVRNGDG